MKYLRAIFHYILGRGYHDSNLAKAIAEYKKAVRDLAEHRQIVKTGEDPDLLDLAKLEAGRLDTFFGVPAVYQALSLHPQFSRLDLSRVRCWATRKSRIMTRSTWLGRVIRNGSTRFCATSWDLTTRMRTQRHNQPTNRAAEYAPHAAENTHNLCGFKGSKPKNLPPSQTGPHRIGSCSGLVVGVPHVGKWYSDCSLCCAHPADVRRLRGLAWGFVAHGPAIWRKI